MKTYKCTSCGYVYDPEGEDPDAGIPVEAPVATLSNEWICPSCGATNEEVERD
jgi:rubredoxin